MAPHSRLRLLLDLQCKENEVEMRLADENVEDTLITKSILLYDELELLQEDIRKSLPID